MANENNDATYGILRDLGNGAITLEDAFAKIKGLNDATELTEDSFSDDSGTGNSFNTPNRTVQETRAPEDASGEDSDTKKAQEEAVVEPDEQEEKPKSRRKKKTDESKDEGNPR